MNIEDNLKTFMQQDFTNTTSGTNLGTVFGEGGLFPGTEYNALIDQRYSDTCAIRSQQIILRDYGIDISQEKLIAIAEQNGWYHTGEGTSPEDVGKLLEIAGVECHQSEGNTVFDLVSELSQGHRIIVSVDSGELWAKTVHDRFMEIAEDVFDGQSPDHALIVAGVEVNPYNAYDVKVVLTDPGTGQLRVEYRLDEFMDAWKDSNCFMVSTEEPAPYQFNAVTGCEIPSGFATDYACNSFVIDNGFMLHDDDLYLPNDYVAMYSEEHTIDFGLHDNSDIFSTNPLSERILDPFDDILDFDLS